MSDLDKRPVIHTMKPKPVREVEVDIEWPNGNRILYNQQFGRALRPPYETAALIGFLAAKLACYAPEDAAVKRALNWLEENK